ncbi:uncharacterized protein LTR77_005193 [Saxophila tyrrhenica]|uniref:Uncharacterized protein n=1 Tax=Saxophila tyrrhenica TaxID=1690608 RepID=A0AAV9PBI8_9PEZI|nr:hypothetical protein LTR77_005193 [Saxophila tyrrhenica]
MPPNWDGHSRPPNHRIHRSGEEAEECDLRPGDKHFSLLPPYPELRRKSSAVSKTKTTTAAEGSDERDDEDDVNSGLVDNEAASPSPSPTPAPLLAPTAPSSRAQTLAPQHSATPDPRTHSVTYPTPFTQHRARTSANPDPETSPTSAGSMNRRMQLRQRAAAASSSKTKTTTTSGSTPTVLVPQTPAAELPNDVARTIEHGSPVIHVVPATSPSSSTSSAQEDREDTPKTRVILRLVEESKQQLARADRLITRTRVEKAGRIFEERKRWGVEAELQLRNEEMDALVAAQRDVGEGMTAKGVVSLLARIGGLVMVLWAVWLWCNRVDFEYLDMVRRRYYGLEE